MTTNEPPPYPGDQNPQGVPDYGATPPPPPPGSFPPAPGGYGPAPVNSQKALWSMILGILSIVCCGFFTGIPAIILGNQAKREIAASGGAQTGDGMAKAGVITGIIGSVLFVLAGVLYGILFATGALTLEGTFDTY